MRCSYVAAYIAHEIALPSESASVQLFADQTERTVAVLVKDPSDVLSDGDRGAGVASVVLRGVFGSPDPRDVEPKLAEQVHASRDDRSRLAGGAPFLLVSIDLDVEPDLTGAHADQPGYSVYFDAIDKQQVRAAARPLLSVWWRQPSSLRTRMRDMTE